MHGTPQLLHMPVTIVGQGHLMNNALLRESLKKVVFISIKKSLINLKSAFKCAPITSTKENINPYLLSD